MAAFRFDEFLCPIEVGHSPVYLTQVFQQVEGLPLYRYQMQLRLARSLDLLSQYDDLTSLSLDLGFYSHSHFSTAFKQALPKFAVCMRENGVNLPAPNSSGNGPVFNTKGLDTSSTQFKRAQSKCQPILTAARGQAGPGPGAPGGPAVLRD